MPPAPPRRPSPSPPPCPGCASTGFSCRPTSRSNGTRWWRPTRPAGPATTCPCLRTWPYLSSSDPFCEDLRVPDTPDIADRHDAVCVIGAGGSGLAAIKNLREQGFAVDCYERETSVGGAWNWRHDRSPVYAGTHLISSRPLTEFPDFPMPDSWPD